MLNYFALRNVSYCRLNISETLFSMSWLMTLNMSAADKRFQWANRTGSAWQIIKFLAIKSFLMIQGDNTRRLGNRTNWTVWWVKTDRAQLIDSRSSDLVLICNLTVINTSIGLDVFSIGVGDVCKRVPKHQCGRPGSWHANSLSLTSLRS